MRKIVSTIGTAPYGTSKYLVDIIQSILNKNKHHVINSKSFVNEAATWETIRLAASKNSSHFTIHLRKENPRSARN